MTDPRPAADTDASPRLAWLTHPNPLVRWGGRAWLLLGLLLVGWALWHLAGILRLVIAPLAIALFPAGVLMPVVDWLDRRGWRRGLAAFVGTFAFVVVLVGVLVLLGWQISEQLSGIADQVGQAWKDLRTSIGDPSWLPTTLDPSALMGSSTGSGSSGGGASGGTAQAAVGVGRTLVTVSGQLFLGLVALFFYLRDGRLIGRFLAGLFPARHEDDAKEIGERTWATVTAYIRGQTIVALVDGTLFALGLLLSASHWPSCSARSSRSVPTSRCWARSWPEPSASSSRWSAAAPSRGCWPSP